MTAPNKESGFTLIELLVVIAIIGLLSSIVLAALNSAKLKAQDARVMGEASSLRASAEMFRSSYNVYFISGNPGASNAPTVSPDSCLQGDGCGFAMDTTSGGKQIMTDINKLSTCNWLFINPTSYVYATILPSQNTEAGFACSESVPSTIFCVDSSGASGKVNAMSMIIKAGNIAYTLNYNGTFSCL